MPKSAKLQENYIYSSATDMLLALGDEANEILRPLEFHPTQYPDEDCPTCPFQKMCGADPLWAQ